MQTIERRHLLSPGARIGGEWIAGETRFAVRDPSNGAVIAEVADLGADAARNAVDAAARALPTWRRSPANERSRLIEAWAGALLEAREDLARLLTWEQGKPLRQARDELSQGAASLRWFAEENRRAQGHTLPVNNAGVRNLTIKQPVGVVTAITPWNFPAAAVLVKCGAAMAAGCTVVLKPSEFTPLIALAVARLAAEVGIPAGVLNVVTCSSAGAVGEVLTTEPRVQMVSFTGSTQVGKAIMGKAAGGVKKVALELGGNAPFIVFEDADLAQAADAAIGARFYNSGQICIGANRFFVQDSIYERFVSELAARVARLRLGSGFEPDTDVGPLINEQAVAKVASLVDEARSQGARAVVGGQRAARGGLFYEPTVLRDVTPAMALYRTEIFGPVAPVYRFSSEDEVIARANETDAGLSAYVYTSQVGRLWRMSEELEAGMVGANTTSICAPEVPFGGIKHSGLGREGGPGCLDEYLEVKSICFGL
ncbi:MAG TPA: NAD-dependent succinate-semialdehyde dehydrogenase [Archangium sp.]|uniref:NAD-dependent succinate-semialdehyde dehydrogenase n=1 Tax=Archangium sp. TaxID=1872627 RepID=UPI002E37BACC|nr:NAD-dependent succinate-semialdehyde dehydrogenase [Archangium sp.]HEX5746822.1 NAD-dependent succinate-semialdehyde dehydrogenase [Archangium sp.]